MSLAHRELAVVSSVFATTDTAKNASDRASIQPDSIPVLARLPRVEVPQAASNESRQFRIDRPENVASSSEPEIVDAKHSELEADLALAADDDSPDRVELPEPVSRVDDDCFASIDVTPAHVIRTMHARQQQSSTARALLGAYALIRPLSRVIVLAVLLIASALVYVLLDDRTVQVPSPPLDHQAPSWTGGPKLTSSPDSRHQKPRDQNKAELALRSAVTPMAQGPGGKKPHRRASRTNPTPPDNTAKLRSDARKATRKPPVSAFREAIAASERRLKPSGDIIPIPAASIVDPNSLVATTSATANTSQQYPNTGYADHQLPFGNLSEMLQSRAQVPAQATLTGKIESTELR